MSTDRQHGKLIFICDTCSETYEGESGEWNEVWPLAKEEGWKAEKVGLSWDHKCPGCGHGD